MSDYPGLYSRTQSNHMSTKWKRETEKQIELSDERKKVTKIGKNWTHLCYL